MTDLISRQAAINALEWEKTYCTAYRDGYTPANVFEKYNAGITDGIKALKRLPTIDPVKRGKWLLHEYPDGYYHTECSECGAVYGEMVYFSKKAHYCPNCGARNGGEG